MKKILIVDDDSIFSKAISLRLEKRGFLTSIGNSGEDAISKLKNGHFDLVLLDIKMAGMKGTDALKKIRTIWKKNVLPIIMVSSCDDQEDIVGTLKMGANDYITKPIDIEILLARINTQLEIQELSFKFAEEKERGALTAMIATYNHQINNPLAIALASLNKLKKNSEVTDSIVERMEYSLSEIREIVKKISKITEDSDFSYEHYSGNSNMLNLTSKK